MKKLLLTLLPVCLLAGAFFSCSSKDRNCIDEKYHDFTSYHIPVNLETDGLKNETLYRITSQEEFDNIFGDFEGKKPIDFNRMELLFVKGQENSGIEEFEQYWLSNFSVTRFEVYIYIKHNIASVAPLWNSAMVVEKLDDEIPVDLNIYRSDI